MLLYVDGISCPGINEAREQSPLNYWTLDKLQKMESMEIKQGGFGLGDILEHFVGDGVDETDAEVETENHDNSTIKKYIFLMYLHLMGHPKATEIETCQIEKLRISWLTTNNFVDCGIFVMRHMEMYMGNHTRAWDCGFPKDERAKKTKCNLLRKKYAYKILTSDINMHKDRVLKEANDLDNEANEY
ncbi:hypothetical protein R6Q57_010915 [Mikania cordata]